jgi:hypothetical protein
MRDESLRFNVIKCIVDRTSTRPVFLNGRPTTGLSGPARSRPLSLGVDMTADVKADGSCSMSTRHQRLCSIDPRKRRGQ